MNNSSLQQPLIDNEVTFRQANEGVHMGMQQLQQLAREDGQQIGLDDDTLELHYYCECSDENCKQRIVIKAAEYEEIHHKRNRFIILPDHDVIAIERVIEKKPAFWIVEKLLAPPETADGLQATDVDNSSDT